LYRKIRSYRANSYLRKNDGLREDKGHTISMISSDALANFGDFWMLFHES